MECQTRYTTRLERTLVLPEIICGIGTASVNHSNIRGGSRNLNSRDKWNFCLTLTEMPETGETMTRRLRRNHSPAFKAKVALAAIRGEQTLVELSQQFDVHTNPIKQWKDQFLEGTTGVFGDEAKAEPADAGSGLLQRANTDDGGSIVEAEIHLEKRPKLFKQTEPPLAAQCAEGPETS